MAAVDYKEHEMVQLTEDHAGSHSRYSKGCRCAPCTQAHRVYTRDRKRLLARANYGIESVPNRYIDAAEVRDHLHFLSKKGIGVESLHERTGISRSTLQAIKSGRRAKVEKRIYDKLLSIPGLAFADGQYVDASKAHKLIKDLLRAGYTKAEISRAFYGRNASLRINKKIRKARFDRLVKVHQYLMTPSVRVSLNKQRQKIVHHK